MLEEIYRLALAADGRVGWFSTTDVARARTVAQEFVASAPRGFAVGLAYPADSRRFDAAAGLPDEGGWAACVVRDVPEGFAAAMCGRSRLVRRDGEPWVALRGGLGDGWIAGVGRCGPVPRLASSQPIGRVSWVEVAEGAMPLALQVFGVLWGADLPDVATTALEDAVVILNASPPGEMTNLCIEADGTVSYLAANGLRGFMLRDGVIAAARRRCEAKA